MCVCVCLSPDNKAACIKRYTYFLVEGKMVNFCQLVSLFIDCVDSLRFPSYASYCPELRKLNHLKAN